MTHTHETMKPGLRPNRNPERSCRRRTPGDGGGASPSVAVKQLSPFRKAFIAVAAILAAQVALAGYAPAQAMTDTAGFGTGKTMVLAANDTAPPSASAASPAGEMVIVKPMKPTTTPSVDPVSLTEDTRQVMTAFADELAGYAKTLEARQGDVALCYDAAKGQDGQPSAPRGLDYYECVAKAVAETEAGWTAMAGSFHHFAGSLDKIATQVGSLQTYVGNRSQAIADQYRQTQASIADGRKKLLLVKAAVARGHTLTPDQTRQARLLIDDVWSMYQRGKLLDGEKAVLDGAAGKLTAYGNYITDLKGEAGVQEHIAKNRADTWSAMLVAVRDQSTLSDLDNGMATLDKGLKDLGPTLAAIRGLQGAELPALPGGGTEVTPTATLSVPNEDIGPLLDRVLGLTSDKAGS